METIVEKMQDENNGIPIRTVKSFMSKIPSVFIGSDLMQWLSKRLECDDISMFLMELMFRILVFFCFSRRSTTLRSFTFITWLCFSNR
jgi:regulator of G-protein signaling